MYHDVPYRTSEETRAQAERRARTIRLGVSILIVWLVGVPAVIAILGWANPWIGGATTVYSLWQAYKQWLKLTGRKKKSERDLKKDEEERLMKHHHHHCMANLDGFNRLKMENFERWQREELEKEVSELRAKGRQ